MARACVSPRVCARETLREKKNRLRTFIPSDPRSQDTIARTLHALLQKTIYDRIRRAAPFWCVCCGSRGFCVDPRTPKALQVERPHRTKKSRLVVETERAVEWGLRPALSIRHDDVSWPANRTHLVLCAAGERGVKQRRHTEAGGKQSCVPKRVRVPFRQAWR